MFFTKEHAGVRVIEYPDHTVVYPYTPGARRSAGYVDPEGNFVSVEKRKQNLEKVVSYRRRKAENLVKCSVEVLAKNQGVFFTVTTGMPGRHSGKIRRLIEHMKRKYGLLYYTWVRELTQSGLVHWHFAAVFQKRGLEWVRWMKQPEASGRARIVELSIWWSGFIGANAHGNSIRLGWAYKNGRPQKYLLDKKAVGYLIKYLMKQEKKEERVRGWTTNLDWLRPVRFDVYKCRNIFPADRPVRFLGYEVVGNDDKYLAEINVSVFRPAESFKRPPDDIRGGIEYYAKIWNREVDFYNLRLIANIN